jgi:nuclear GTP-binding protein
LLCDISFLHTSAVDVNFIDSSSLLQQKGELDLNGAARVVLRDWSVGKIMRYTTLPVSAVNAIVAQSSPAAKLADSISELYVNDEAIISIVQTRKERRKQGGLVGFTCGSIDPRKAAMEESWNGEEEENSDDEGDDDEVEGEDDGEGMNVDREDEEGEEEEAASDPEMEESSHEAEEDAEPSSTHKRKRGRERSMPLPRAKKVAFTATPAKFVRTEIEATMKSNKESMKTTQQKQKPVQASETTHTIPQKGKIANVKTRPKGHIVALGESRDKSEPEAYDFGKFF